MDFSSPFFIMFCVTGLLLAILGFYMKKNPPKKINHFYGYRTKRSMKSQEAWDFAQVYSSDIMVNIGLLHVLMSFIVVFLQESALIAFVFIGMIITTFGYLIYKTEVELKKRFP